MTKKSDFKAAIKRSFFLILLISTISLSLTGCNLPTTQNISSAQPQNTNGDLHIESVDVTFNLSLPAPTETNETVNIEILDEVTGLPHNINRLPMKQEADLNYYLTVSAPLGSVIKYRYTKTGSDIVPEINTNGEPVRYRLAYIGGTTNLADILHAWYGEESIQPTGILTGTVIDMDTKLPVPDILISAGGFMTFTDVYGQFMIQGLPEGIHNVVFYSPNGHYKSYQQGADISSGLTTEAKVSIRQMPSVTVTFDISVPNEGLGAPIYMAGNISALGNTFSDLPGGLSVLPQKMPVLKSNNDGTYSITLNLYAQTDLRYKFTLGDGYWNAERDDTGAFLVRQLIVPEQNTTISHTIKGWRAKDLSPVTLNVFIPPGLSQNPLIQFNNKEWTQPIPLWPLGSGNYLFIFFAPLPEGSPANYRICLEPNCQQVHNPSSDETIQNTSQLDTPQSINLVIDPSFTKQTTNFENSVVEAFVPQKSQDYATIIELDPTLNLSDYSSVQTTLDDLNTLGANTVILSPGWSFNYETSTVSPLVGTTPFYFDLAAIFQLLEGTNLNVGLYPQYISTESKQDQFVKGDYNDSDWDVWFASYRQFILNYAKIAELFSAKYLVLGGRSALPTYPGAFFPNQDDNYFPKDRTADWDELIDEIRKTYKGTLVWATNISETMDPLPDFIQDLDQIYVIVDSPLSTYADPSIDQMSAVFNNLVDNYIYEVYRSTAKPVLVGFGYPSLEDAIQGCNILSPDCTNDGLYSADEVQALPVGLNEQAAIYNALFPVAASRDWVKGIATRGYHPSASSQNGTSSINHKPAQEVIKYWFLGFNGQ